MTTAPEHPPTRDRSRARLPRLLREDTVFRRYWSAHTISLFGDQISLLAIPLLGVLVLDANAAQMGYLTAAGWLPYLLFSLHAGAWVDRRGRRRRTMIAADVGRAAVLLSVPLAYAADVLTLPQLYFVALAVGTFSVVFGVADTSLFVSIVSRDRYLEANSLLNGSRAFSFVAGPSITGVLVQLLTAPAALVLDALSFLGSAAFLQRIAPREVPTDPEGGSVLVGLRWILGSRIVRDSLLATATVNFFNFVFWALFVLYATRSLGVEPGTLGLVLGAGAVGGIVGSVVTAPLARRIGVGPAFVLGCVVFPAPLLLVPLAGGSDPVVLALLFLAEFGSGLGVMILDISAGSIFAAVIPHRLRSRVSGAYTFANYGVRVAGSLVGGLLGSAIGLRPTLWIATGGALLGVLFLLPGPLPRLRELPEPDEPGGGAEARPEG
jgi:MFS family permease